jgi:hypothetical protein
VLHQRIWAGLLIVLTFAPRGLGRGTGRNTLLAPTPIVKSPYSIQVNGSSQYADVPNLPLNVNADFTIEGWVKLTANATNNAIFAGAQDNNNYFMLVARNDANGLCFQVAFNSASATFIGASAATIAVADGWTHVAMTRAGNLYSFYKNGVFLKSATQAGSLQVGSEALGRLPSPFNVFYSGYLYDIRVWSIARSEGQILANMKLVQPIGTKYMGGQWRATSSPLFMLPDTSGAGNNARLVTSPTISTDIPY